MNKKTILIIVAVVLVTLGLMLWGRQNISAQPAASNGNVKSVLAASETAYDFGTISMARGKVSHLFTVTNSASEKTVVDDVLTSCMCTSAYLTDGSVRKGPFGMPGMGMFPKADTTIKPGGKVTLEIIFDPAAHGPAGVGAIDRFAYLREANGGVTQFEIKALVTP